MKKINAKVIDLFCGAGGLTYGLQKSGLSVALGVDLDPLCEYPFTANTRAKFLEADVSSISAQVLAKHYGRTAYKVLVGCAPCQPFSSYTQGMKIRDSRWALLTAFGRLASALKPNVISMENVAQLTKHQIYLDFVDSLKATGYTVSENIVECLRYGVPQTRKRLVLLASLYGKIELVKPNRRQDDPRNHVRHALAGISPLRAGEFSLRDKLHCASGLSDRNLERIAASMPGGTWKDWDPELRAICHTRESGAHYSGVYGRMEWDQPSPTITTQFYGFGSGRFGHPEQDRALSLREAAILQTFPRSYKFVAPRQEVNFKGVGRLIGNAVPVRLGAAIGRSILRHLKAVESHA
ncbi:MAG: DNA cytosine methyltransferase [Terracidiphilus sp.]